MKSSSKEIPRSSRQQLYQVRDTVDIRPLKALVIEKFPKNCALRNALLAERDILKTNEFLAKMETWLNLLRMAY